MFNSSQPRGKLAIQTIAMPNNTNVNGDIFGGWLVSQMDLAGAIVAQQRALSRTVTVAIDSMVFHHPVKVSDIVRCYADIIKVGRTSITIHINVWTESLEGALRQVTQGTFTYVAIDQNGRPQPVDK